MVLKDFEERTDIQIGEKFSVQVKNGKEILSGCKIGGSTDVPKCLWHASELRSLLKIITGD